MKQQQNKQRKFVFTFDISHVHRVLSFHGLMCYTVDIFYDTFVKVQQVGFDIHMKCEIMNELLRMKSVHTNKLSIKETK